MLTTRSICSIRSLAICALLGMVSGGIFLATPVRAADLITLASFNGPNGSRPNGSLIADAAGNLYGTTSAGGANGRGTVFKLDPATGGLTTLASFNGANGSSPDAGLIADATGNLYGTTLNGGANGYGTVFKFNLFTGALATIVSFNDITSGFPRGLIADAIGNLYGTTSGALPSNFGTVFKFDSATGVLTTLASFDGANGRFPNGSLLADADGNLYGTTSDSVPSSFGTVFKFDSATGVLTTLASFDGANGRFPNGSLLAVADGNLYGTTRYGGANDRGTVFKLDPTTGGLTTLVSFNGANGSSPDAGLIADAVGNLYGTTSGGVGGSYGTIFKLDPITGVLTTLASFNGANGADPSGGLIVDADGNLYGTTYGTRGGYYQTVFKLTDTGFVVPEPASLSLLALGIAAMVRRRRA